MSYLYRNIYLYKDNLRHIKLVKHFWLDFMSVVVVRATFKTVYISCTTLNITC